MGGPWAQEPGGIGGGAELVSKLEKAAGRRGVRILTSTRARRLVRNEKGRVVGVEVSQADDTRVLRAHKAVVLTSGGFTRNPELIEQYGSPGAQHITPLKGLGSLGHGLLMGDDIKADNTSLETGGELEKEGG